ncbi:unnamed protein product [Rangifer tarandus platyrhynchus]|uniref:Uncharacterized protein n=1 Tax=Rangifer tarandus platyrhynchus TaxID=3082113 RepID=A0AC59Y223_RANTA
MKSIRNTSVTVLPECPAPVHLCRSSHSSPLAPLRPFCHTPVAVPSHAHTRTRYPSLVRGFLRAFCRKPLGAANTSCSAQDRLPAKLQLTVRAQEPEAAPTCRPRPAPPPRACGPMGWAPGGGRREAGGWAAEVGAVVAVAAGAAAAAALAGRPRAVGDGGGGGGRECRAVVRVRHAGWSAAVSVGWRRSFQLLWLRLGTGVTGELSSTARAAQAAAGCADDRRRRAGSVSPGLLVLREGSDGSRGAAAEEEPGGHERRP